MCHEVANSVALNVDLMSAVHITFRTIYKTKRKYHFQLIFVRCIAPHQRKNNSADLEFCRRCQILVELQSRTKLAGTDDFVSKEAFHLCKLLPFIADDSRPPIAMFVT